MRIWQETFFFSDKCLARDGSEQTCVCLVETIAGGTGQSDGRKMGRWRELESPLGFFRFGFLCGDALINFLIVELLYDLLSCSRNLPFGFLGASEQASLSMLETVEIRGFFNLNFKIHLFI